MIYLNRTEILLKAYEVADEIKRSPDFTELLRLKKHIEENFKEESKAYQIANSKFGEIQVLGGQYHPDFKKTVLELASAKKTLFEKEEVKKYLSLEQKIQADLDDLSRVLASIVSSHVKAPNELGFLKESSCHAG